MDSAPRQSPDGARRSATGSPHGYGRAGASRSVVRRAVGGLATAAARFGRSLGLSQVGRWGLDRADVGDVDQLAVRPPIEYWPWPDAPSQAPRRPSP